MCVYLCRNYRDKNFSENGKRDDAIEVPYLYNCFLEVINMLVELHCHSRFSDGLARVEEIMLVAARELGAIAITDHGTLDGYKAAKRLKPAVLLIPGAEITSQDGHIIALGINEIVKSNMPALDTVDAIHAQGGIAVAAHPFGGLTRPGIHAAEILKRMDAIEVLNGGTFMRQNSQAFALAQKLKKPKVSGSDAHLLKNVGSFACEIKADSIDDILSAIKRGRIKLPDRRTSAFSLIIDKTRRGIRIG